MVPHHPLPAPFATTGHARLLASGVLHTLPPALIPASAPACQAALQQGVPPAAQAASLGGVPAQQVSNLRPHRARAPVAIATQLDAQFSVACKPSRAVRCHRLPPYARTPPDRFFGDDDTTVRVTHTSWVTAHEALLYIGMGAIVGGLVLAGVTPGAVAFAVVGVSIVGYIGNYLHQSFHIKAHPLSKYAWYRGVCGNEGGKPAPPTRCTHHHLHHHNMQPHATSPPPSTHTRITPLPPTCYRPHVSTSFPHHFLHSLRVLGCHGDAGAQNLLPPV